MYSTGYIYQLNCNAGSILLTGKPTAIFTNCTVQLLMYYGTVLYSVQYSNCYINKCTVLQLLYYCTVHCTVTIICIILLDCTVNSTVTIISHYWTANSPTVQYSYYNTYHTTVLLYKPTVLYSNYNIVENDFTQFYEFRLPLSCRRHNRVKWAPLP